MSEPSDPHTDTAITVPVLRVSKREIRRKERHAAVEAASAGRRKARKAPRREDVARAGLFIILMQYRGSRHDSSRAVVRDTLIELLTDAGFSRDETARVFDDLTDGFGPDLDRWLMLRGIERENEIRQRWRQRVASVLSAAD
ncbi:hypothetical protein [Methylobacterium nigriterrae]|uniref:hypothetical protein n=1 Tax=Methylobacterium nigriterrae TaxID=3127512 RepID=UPI0030132FAC